MFTNNRLPTLKWVILLSLTGFSCSTLQVPPNHELVKNETLSDSEKYLLKATTHTVRKGDTLYSIAKRYQISLNELMRLNHLNSSSVLRPGQVLRISTPPTASLPPPAIPSQQPTRQIAPNYGGSSPAVTPSTKPLENKHCAPAVSWQWPTSGKFTETMAVTGNLGISIAGNLGQPVRAAANGIVTYSGLGVSGYDNLITIQHNDAFLSAYAHNRKRLVNQGTEVKAGQIIAEMGINANKQPSLHFEIRCHGKAINPLPFLPR
jgi:murein DD-endopeptidase MepM/ murein hydrolase activator NlpD